MIFYSSSYPLQSLLLIIIVIFLSSGHFILEILCQQQINGRISPSCSLVNDHIYCYGGFLGGPNNVSIGFTSPLNDNIELDLTVLFNNNDFTTFDKTKINWTNNSKSINNGSAETEIPSVGRASSATLSDGTILFYGGFSGGRGYKPNSMPFIHFNPQTNSWNNIGVPNNTYYTRNQIINIGNDRMWIYGGISFNMNIPSTTFYIYDYKNNFWPVIQSTPEIVPVDYTATLVNDLIYIVGGQHSGPTNPIQASPFNQFKTYNTNNGTWNNVTSGGANPESRRFHSTVLTDDGKYLLIYGGVRFQNSDYLTLPCTDVYYVYDIASNSLQYISLDGNLQSSINTRYGHYATIYKSNYLLLVFGMGDLNTTSESLNVLNVQDVYKPSWVEVPGNIVDPNNNNSDETKKKIITAVVVSVVGALLIAGGIGLFIFIRNRKRRQKKAFKLVQEDPRNAFDMKAVRKGSQNRYGYDDDDNNGSQYLNTEEPSTTVVGTSYNNNDHNNDENRQYGKLYEDNVMNSANQGTIKPSENQPIKPSGND